MEKDLQKQEIFKKYDGLVLAYRNYQARDGKQEFLNSDFSNVDTLVKVLNEISAYETDLTKFGKEFLDEYFGLPRLAQLLADSGGIEEEQLFQSQEILNWLESLEAYVVGKFILKARKK